jgi:ABC-type uncharacterized transport system fused permease/ATPase subunit
MSNIGDYNYIYGLIEEHGYVINSITLTISGSVTFGVPGAIIGLGISLIDEALTYTKVTKVTYLSKVFIGLELGYTIYPSYITASFGAVCGILSSTDYAAKYIKNHDIIYPIISIITGTSRGGAKGALISGVVGIADQLLVYNDIIDKHYFTYSLIGVFATGSAIGNSIITCAGGAALGAVFANYEKKIELGEKLYNIHANILEPHQLENHLSSYIQTIFRAQIIHQQCMIRIMQYERDMVYQFEHLDDNHAKSLSGLYTITLKFFLFVIPFAAYELSSQTIKNYYSTKLYLEVDDNLRDLLFTNETALRLSYDKNATVLIDNLRTDAKIISYDGAKLITDAVAKVTNGLYGFSIIVTNSPDLLLYSIIYNQITQYISRAITIKQSTLNYQMKQQETAILTELKHEMQNIEIIHERQGIAFTKNKLVILNNQLRKYELERDQLSTVFEVWMYFTSVTDFLYNYYLVGYKISIGEVNFNNRKIVHYGSWQVSKLLSWSEKKAQEIEKVYRSIESIELFLNKTKYYYHDSKDQIIRIVTDTKNEHNKLILLDLTITVKDQVLVRVDHLELDYSKRYALTGRSGDGKSILISKIMGTKENQIGGTGIVKYMKNAKILLVSQQDYFPLNVTLQEVVFYPDTVTKNKISLVKDLLDEVGIIQYSLNQTENWYSVLSGGEKKKLFIISSIIKQPDILILDEAFNGLDQKSIQLLQKLIETHLHKSLIISIDHNVNENNQTGFYTGQLEITKGSLLMNYDNDDKDNICPYENHLNFFNNCILIDDICCVGMQPG